MDDNFFKALIKLTWFPFTSFKCPSSFRWDIQRIREQRMFQRLQQRMNKQKVIQESEPELLSFYPETEDGMSHALLQLIMIVKVWKVCDHKLAS